MDAQTPKDLVDDVIRETGLTLEEVAERIGLKKRTLEKIKWGDIKLTDANRIQLQNLRGHYTKGTPSFGGRHQGDSPSRISEESPMDASGSGGEGPAEMSTHYSTPVTDLPEILDAIAEGMTPPQLAAMIQRLLGDRVGSNPRTKAAEYLNEVLSRRLREHTRRHRN